MSSKRTGHKGPCVCLKRTINSELLNIQWWSLCMTLYNIIIVVFV